MHIEKVNLEQKLQTFSEHWTPKIVGELNGQQVKLAKFSGDFVMHSHEHEDELFFVIQGVLYIELHDQTLEIQQGEFVIIPRGVEHRPYAEQEVQVMLFEPAATINTGDKVSELTVSQPEHI